MHIHSLQFTYISSHAQQSTPPTQLCAQCLHAMQQVIDAPIPPSSKPRATHLLQPLQPAFPEKTNQQPQRRTCSPWRSSRCSTGCNESDMEAMRPGDRSDQWDLPGL